jgi:hypothetical protein
MRHIESKALFEILYPGEAICIDGAVDWELDELGLYKIKNVHFTNPNIKPPTKEEYDQAYAQALAEWNSTVYKIKRKQEYPPLADLADALYWQAQGDESKMTAYLSAVQDVKNKYPKEQQ